MDDVKKKAWTEIGRTILLIIPTLFLGSATLIFPFGRDQGEYATIAMEVLSGKVAYVDVFNIKPPLTHIIHTWAIQLFGYTMLSIRFMDLLWQCVTVGVIVLFLKRYSNYATAVVFAFIYPFFYFSTGYWYTAQTDGFLTLPIVLSLSSYWEYQEKNNRLRLFASGFFIGLAVLFKYPIGILLVFLSFALIKKKKFWKNIIVLWIGFLLPLLIFVLDLLRHKGLSNFISSQYTYISKYSFGIGLFEPRVILFIILLIVIIALLVVYRIKDEYYLLILWWMSALIHLIIQNKLYLYHFYPLLAPTLIVFANGIALIHQKLASRFRFHSSWGVVILTILFMASYSNSAYRTLHGWTYDVLNGTQEIEETYKQFMDIGDYSIKADMDVSNYIKNHTSPEENIFIWGFEPTIYFLSERHAGTRFIYNFPFFRDLGFKDIDNVLIDEIVKNKPVYIVIVEDDNLPWLTGSTESSFELLYSFDELEHLMSERYEFETKIEDFYLYHIRKY